MGGTVELVRRVLLLIGLLLVGVSAVKLYGPYTCNGDASWPWGQKLISTSRQPFAAPHLGAADELNVCLQHARDLAQRAKVIGAVGVALVLAAVAWSLVRRQAATSNRE